MSNIDELESWINREKEMVFELFDHLRPFAEYWPPPAPHESVEAYRKLWFPNLHESHVELWLSDNGVLVSDRIVYGALVPKERVLDLQYEARILDPSRLLVPSVDPKRFVERGYVPISPDVLVITMSPTPIIKTAHCCPLSS